MYTAVVHQGNWWVEPLNSGVEQTQNLFRYRYYTKPYSGAISKVAGALKGINSQNEDMWIERKGDSFPLQWAVAYIVLSCRFSLVSISLYINMGTTYIVHFSISSIFHTPHCCSLMVLLVLGDQKKGGVWTIPIGWWFHGRHKNSTSGFSFNNTQWHMTINIPVLDPSCNKCCDLIGQKQVSISLCSSEWHRNHLNSV